ncbi:MAG: cytochrome c biogenesis protein CcsA [Candidatus Bipolaricaulia bacterium]
MTMVDSVFFFYLGTIGYFLSFLFYLFHVVLGGAKAEAEAEAQRGNDSRRLGITAESTVTAGRIAWGKLATRTGWVAVTIATIGVVMRVIELGRTSEWTLTVFLPVTTTYETLTFFAWLISLIYLIMERRYPIKPVGMIVTGAALVMLSFAASPSISPADVRPVVPSLQSYWLVIHVLFMVVGFGFFTVGFGANALFLWARRRGKQESLLKKIEQMSYRAIALGFPFYGIGGLVLGGIWAKQAWGAYWEWDPKETAMLAAWLVYAVYLHARFRWGWKDLKVAWLGIAGYLAVLYAWVGINYFVASLHSFT